eukprot:TRINITY_DN18580_c0_g1_i1.p1 TRINITY_DN18580_c0_g1~~TRINITY_DN18580_c0_g1_i1.p1  ORF type:complete len:899 (+),score=278.92 TRINITY_DN18580_c0_g1_i1:76-2697(+)
MHEAPEPFPVVRRDAALTDRIVPDSELAHTRGTFLDYGGSGLYLRSQLEAAHAQLAAGLLGNPHSLNQAGAATRGTIDAARRELLQHFSVSEEQYTVVFTSGATAALKLVGELFPFAEGSAFAPCEYNHNSVLGIREYCTARGGRYRPVPAARADSSGLAALGAQAVARPLRPRLLAAAAGVFLLFLGRRLGLRAATAAAAVLLAPLLALRRRTPAPGPSLAAVPLVCNFSGRVFPLDWCGALRVAGQGRWYSLVDAAAAFGKRPIDLSAPGCQPDFLTVSFYKAFGSPTGLGALLVRKGSEGVLRKLYFGGGTVDASSASEQWHVPRPSLSAWLEDGTPNFLSIAAARHGLQLLSAVGMDSVQRRLQALTVRLRDALRGLTHADGSPVCVVYGHSQGVAHSGVVSFNVYDALGAPVGYAAVVEAANVSGVQLRGGCFCNPGACQELLGLTLAEVRQHREAGHVCGDAVDVVGGRPTGAVRASLGPYSSEGDVDALVGMLRDYFASAGVPAAPPVQGPPADSGELLVDSLWVYPVKGARGLRIDGAWPLTQAGFLFDRHWCVAAADGAAVGNPLGQKACPALAELQPVLLPSTGSLALVHAPSGRSHAVPLMPPQGRTHGTLSVRGKRREGAGLRYGDETSAWLSDVLGQPVHLVLRLPVGSDGRQGDGATLANQSALLVVNKASVDSFNEQLREKVEERRFRPNIVLAGAEPWAEDRWGDLKLPGSDVTVTMGEPCARCTQITISGEPPHRPALDGEPLLTLMRIRRIRGQAFFGVHAGVSGAPPAAGRYSAVVEALAKAEHGRGGVAAQLSAAARTGVQPALSAAELAACGAAALAAGTRLTIAGGPREPPPFEAAHRSEDHGAGSGGAAP